MSKPVFDIAENRASSRPQLTPCVELVARPDPLDVARDAAALGVLDWQAAIDGFLNEASKWRGACRESS